jgi:hypothetical protein
MRSWSESAGYGWRVPRGEAGSDGEYGLCVVAVRSACGVGPSSENEQGRSVLRGGSKPRRNGWRQRFLRGEKILVMALSRVRIIRYRRNGGPGQDCLGFSSFAGARSF